MGGVGRVARGGRDGGRRLRQVSRPSPARRACSWVGRVGGGRGVACARGRTRRQWPPRFPGARRLPASCAIPPAELRVPARRISHSGSHRCGPSRPWRWSPRSASRSPRFRPGSRPHRDAVAPFVRGRRRRRVSPRSGAAGLAAADDVSPVLADGAPGVVSRTGIVVADTDGRARVLALTDRGAPGADRGGRRPGRALDRVRHHRGHRVAGRVTAGRRRARRHGGGRARRRRLAVAAFGRRPGGYRPPYWTSPASTDSSGSRSPTSPSSRSRNPTRPSISGPCCPFPAGACGPSPEAGGWRC